MCKLIRFLLGCCLTLTVIAQVDIISGSETEPAGQHCVLCTHKVPYVCTTANCGVTEVIRQIVSEHPKSKETYPGSPISACIPCDCGNHKDDHGEECDDGNNVGFDGCTADCKKEICGDGVKQPRNFDGVAEECDAGNTTIIPDQCRPDCKLPRCGDNTTDPANGEECDQGINNAEGLTGCDTKCHKIICGDKIKNGAELCDDGNTNNSDECTNACVPAKCQDGFVQEGKELCDGTAFSVSLLKPTGMPQNIFDAKTCDTTCNPVYGPYCGDGVKNGTEACEGTNFGTKPANVSDAKWGTRKCDPVTCEIEYGPHCGDAIVNLAETCDGSAFITKPAGLSDAKWAHKKCNVESCQIEYDPFCGDGDQNGTEACEDGNLVSGDGCSSTCQLEDPCANAKLPENSASVTYRDRNRDDSSASICFRGKFSAVQIGTTPNGFPTYGITDLATGDDVTSVFRAAGLQAAKAQAIAQGSDVNKVYEFGGNYAGIHSVIEQSACFICVNMRVGGCFDPETLIKMADGTDKKASEIRKGDKVFNPVTKKSYEILSAIQSGEDKPLFEITTKNGTVKVTETHPVLSNKGSVMANKLKVGDSLISAEGKETAITKIQVLPVKSGQQVVNFILDGESEKFDDHQVLANGIVTGDLFVQKSINKE